MADAVTNKVLIDTDRLIEIHLTNISDGSGESGVVKVDPASVNAFTFNKLQPTYFAIMEVVGQISGFSSVEILFDSNSPAPGVVLAPGYNHIDFTKAGGLFDPLATGTTGKIKLTTVGASASSTYDITLLLKKSRAASAW